MALAFTKMGHHAGRADWGKLDGDQGFGFDHVKFGCHLDVEVEVRRKQIDMEGWSSGERPRLEINAGGRHSQGGP